MTICLHSFRINTAMRTYTSQTIYRKNYTPPSFWVETVEMGFDLDPKATRVATRLTIKRNSDSKDKMLTLFGEALQLIQLRMNGTVLTKRAYKLEDGKLQIENALDEVTLEIETLMHPEKN